MNSFPEYVWDADDAICVSPSAVFSLEPIGIGTPYMESLTSYLKRLAHFHHLRVSDFLDYCATQTNENVKLTSKHKLRIIDSTSNSGKTWSYLLAMLTQRPDVLYLSMAYWDSILNSYRLIKQHQSWCPLCYATFQQEQTPVHIPLMWSLQAIDVCLIHEVKLLEHCPYCKQQFSSITSNAMCGFCPKCKNWLGDLKYSHKPDSQDELVYKRARIVGQLLSLAPQVKDHTKNVVPQVIEDIKHTKGLSYTHIQYDLDIAVNNLSKVRAGIRRPSLSTLIKLIMCYGNLLWFELTELEDFRPVEVEKVIVPESSLVQESYLVQQPQQHLKQLIQSTERLPALGTIARQCGYADATALRKVYPIEYEPLRQRVREEQQQALQANLDGDEILSVADIAHLYGYKRSVLSQYFPEICHQITLNMREKRHIYYRNKLREIIGGDELPNVIAICKILDVGRDYLWKNHPNEMNQINKLRQQKSQFKAEYAQSLLDASLASDAFPPQSLNQLANELGCRSNYLNHNFPIRSQQILQRYRDYKHNQIRITCEKIRETVFELHQHGIYPSFGRLYAKINTWMIHGRVYRDVYNQALADCGYLEIDI